MFNVLSVSVFWVAFFSCPHLFLVPTVHFTPMFPSSGLEYIAIFLKELVKDKKGGNAKENIREFCQTAYETTLKMYHSWLVQKVFSVSIHLPEREKCCHVF